ncbi:MAG: CFI-box-CTERM domain-containing protein, partial [Candidatus Hodarchaeota archaeon]
KKSAVLLIFQNQILTSLRDISEYCLEIREGPTAGIRFGIYSVHLKAGTGSDNEAQREEEATILRNYLNDLTPNSLFLICGDFNMRSCDERAFEILTESQTDNDGRSKDPINRLGYWCDNAEFAEIHTQSTRTTQFGGGASGGLDDRFDLILVSYGLNESDELTYKTNSYISYGNDGEHLNQAVNEGENSDVSPDIADALHEASDHLPVIIELEPPVYTLSLSAGTGGTTDPEPGIYSYDPGTEVNITSQPDIGYRFNEWTGDVPSGQEDDNPITITMDSDKSITANFIQQCSLAITTGIGGTTEPSPGTYTYDIGTEVTLKAIPQVGFRFTYWSGNVSSTDNPITVTMDSDKSVTANFIRQYTLTIAVEKGGTTDPSPRSYVYDIGTAVTITAIPDSGREFKEWSGDASGTSNPITITMDSNKKITAKFERCFITTAAYNSPSHPHVRILRHFRDMYLMPSTPGRALVDLYYKYSPFFADLITKHKILKVATRINLLPLVALSFSMIYLGPMITPVLLVLIFVLPIPHILFFRRKMRRVPAK